MTLLVLTESGPGIGYGHISRCIAFSEYWSHYGSVTILDCGKESSFKIPTGIKYFYLDWINRQNDWKEYWLNSKKVLVDSYNWKDDMWVLWKTRKKDVIFFDDGTRKEWYSGIVINSSIGSKEASYPENSDVFKKLIGPKFQPLRKQFWNSKKKENAKNLKNILLYFGGDDLRNIIPQLVYELKKRFESICIFVVIGSISNNLRTIKQIEGINLFIDATPKELSWIFKKIDISIVAAGQITYELASYGIPGVIVQTADNQENNYWGWVNEEAFLPGGTWSDQDLLMRIFRQVEILKSQLFRKEMTQKLLNVMGINSMKNIFISAELIREDNFE